MLKLKEVIDTTYFIIVKDEETGIEQDKLTVTLEELVDLQQQIQKIRGWKK